MPPAARERAGLSPAPALTCPAGGARLLTPGEIALTRSVFGDAIDYAQVTVKRRKFFPLHPRGVTMAPMGHLHFHPGAAHYCDDFSAAPLHAQAHFIHEMTHVWQVQTRGAWHLILRRPFSRRYDYSLKPGWPLERYGIEQQAEIVRHAFLLRLRRGLQRAGAAGARNARLRSRQQAFALGALAGQLAGAANGLGLLAGALLRGLLVVHVALHFTEAAFALHLLLQSLERLIDVIIANENLYQVELSFGRPPRPVRETGRQIKIFLGERGPRVKAG